ncbi:MAG: valine--tRNA ligase [Oligoflexia bacterium]|nr:valine--tRNA ligase [Oligoflexia bacterium]
MESSYNPNSFEQKIYHKWEEEGDFKTSSASEKTFLITMPPPNVTGVLHMGHALFVSIQDTYTRWKRMLGYNTLWLPGTDHAGIATQVMVERQLEAEGTSRTKIGRDAFLKKVWEWKEEYGGTITEQIRALGSSCDWSRELFTLDPKSSKAVRESFTRLYKDGLIYRGERIVNWSSGLQTAISDLEVELKPTEGKLYYLKYYLEDKSDYLQVATTRPETIFADVAVAVHPQDPKWKKFHNKEVFVPLANRKVPVILDEYVDKEFGTGALKITPGHDQNDWLIGKKHHLKTLSCIGKDGKLNELAGEFAGMVAWHSRKKIAESLREKEILIKEEKHQHELGYCQRTGVVVEPLISMQWFLKMESLAKPAVEAASGENPAIRFYPDYWKKTWFEWLNNIQDWCISRQLWWGHQIPAWHCKKCEAITVPEPGQSDNPTKCGSCSSDEIAQDTDVLDTWYSSALWPISTLGWPDNSSDLKIYYPVQKYNEPRNTDEAKALMETGSDILFFWVARMVMMCTHFMGGKIPFEDVFLHAMVRDEKGQKMSKTKGNVVDPLDVTEQHGADSLRLTLLALSGQGRNVNLDLKRLEGYKAFINKIWNATKFCLIQINESEKLEVNASDYIDSWLLDGLKNLSHQMNSDLKNYRPDAAFNAYYQFTWYEFCDWYLELFKIKKGSTKTLQFALDTLIRLLHPMAPMVTEEIYQSLPWTKDEKIIHKEYPIESKIPVQNSEHTEVYAIKGCVEGIRNFRTENKVNPKIKISAYLQTENLKLWNSISPYVLELAKIESIHINTQAPKGAVGRVNFGQFTFTIPLEGLVDKDAEKQRLTSEIKKIEKDLAFSTGRLNNEKFVSKAKPELVEQEKKIVTDLSLKLSSLISALESLGE